MSIKVERQVSEARTDELNVDDWSTWTKEESEFDWSYSDKETCYVLEGEVTVKTDDGEVTIRSGDVAQFEQGLSCVWNVTSDLKKVFTFEPVRLDPDEQL